jgi:hypothetical protein
LGTFWEHLGNILFLSPEWLYRNLIENQVPHGTSMGNIGNIINKLDNIQILYNSLVMRDFQKLVTKKESFPQLRTPFLQIKSGEHFGNINLGTSWECFQGIFLTVKTVFKQHLEKRSLFTRPPNLLTYLYNSW